MNLLLNLPLIQAAGGIAGMSTPIVTFALVIGIFYFLIIRPQNKKQKETKAMIESVEKGDKVTTIGGLRGTVDSVKEGIVTIRVYNDVKLEFNKSAISEVVKDKKIRKLQKSAMKLIKNLKRKTNNK